MWDIINTLKTKFVIQTLVVIEMKYFIAAPQSQLSCDSDFILSMYTILSFTVCIAT